MSTYQNPQDLAKAKDLISLAPKEAQAFLALKTTAERADGVIPEKYRELISIAVALTTQCAYCIDAPPAPFILETRSATVCVVQTTSHDTQAKCAMTCNTSCNARKTTNRAANPESLNTFT
ncbi:carboxymuconolactone decarboxylase family protein [Undibacterium sp. TC9W]|uniref:carboxymuconolactone decarboxylase family protein n=1 Tax=Undibacterium sp. TC9W TaxID=3413053 RepID=UPI003BF1D486